MIDFRCVSVRQLTLLFWLLSFLLVFSERRSAAQEVSSKPAVAVLERPNVLLICVDDLRPELKCFGASYIHSPAIDRLAEQGVRFQQHFVQAPTCGASRYALLTGRYGPAGNDALFRRAKQQPSLPTLPGWFRSQGYETVSVGKVSHHPGGHGGPDWNDPDQPEMPGVWSRTHLPAGLWKHPRGWMHGLANGEIRVRADQMSVFQHAAVTDEAYPDGLTVPQAIEELNKLSRQETPFFLAVGLLRPHLPFGVPESDYNRYRDLKLPEIAAPEKPTGKTTWHRSGEFMKYDRQGKNPNQDKAYADQVRKHYAACVTFADRQVQKLLSAVEEAGVAENTIVVLWGDHGWHLGEHAIWGKHSLFEESLWAPLIVYDPRDTETSGWRKGDIDRRVVETIDIFPTLCDLADLPKPDQLHGSSLLESSRDITERGAISYTASARTLRTSRYRLIVHRSGEKELYDHQQDPNETNNLAKESAELTRELSEQLEERWQKTHETSAANQKQ